MMLRYTRSLLRQMWAIGGVAVLLSIAPILVLASLRPDVSGEKLGTAVAIPMMLFYSLLQLLMRVDPQPRSKARRVRTLGDWLAGIFGIVFIVSLPSAFVYRLLGMDAAARIAAAFFALTALALVWGCVIAVVREGLVSAWSRFEPRQLMASMANVALASIIKTSALWTAVTSMRPATN